MIVSEFEAKAAAFEPVTDHTNSLGGSQALEEVNKDISVGKGGIFVNRSWFHVHLTMSRGRL